MIFYFSGTGNSKYVATYLAHGMQDKAYDIMGFDAFDLVLQEKVIGIVFPVYSWAPPEPVMDFVAKLHLEHAFVFAVATCGAEAGFTMKHLEKVIPLESTYSIVMPNNYIIMSDIDDQSVIEGKLKVALKRMEKIQAEVTARKCVQDVHVGALPRLKSYGIAKLFNRYGRSTKAFNLIPTCNGCTLCEALCPSKAIHMEQDRPVWTGTCYQCLACINSCPQKAIQYGKGTLKRGRYLVSDYVKEV